MNKMTKWLLLAVCLGQSLSFAGLYEAAVENDINEINRLLDSGAKINMQDEVIDRTALMGAIYEGSLEAVKLLLKRGANTELIDNMYNTALLAAVASGYAKDSKVRVMTDIVKELLNYGANINFKNKYGHTPINLASSHWGAALDEGMKAMGIIREWSIEKQIKITDPDDIKILDGKDPGSYNRDFDAHGTPAQRKAEIERVTKIPTKGPGKHIMEYLGEE